MIEEITQLLKLQTSTLEMLLKSPLLATYNKPRFDETRQKFVRLTFGDLVKKSCESVQDIFGKVDSSWDGLLKILRKLRFYEVLSRTNVFEKVCAKVGFDEMFMSCVELSLLKKVEEVLSVEGYSLVVIEVLEEFMEFDYLTKIKCKIIENETIRLGLLQHMSSLNHDLSPESTIEGFCELVEKLKSCYLILETDNQRDKPNFDTKIWNDIKTKFCLSLCESCILFHQYISAVCPDQKSPFEAFVETNRSFFMVKTCIEVIRISDVDEHFQNCFTELLRSRTTFDNLYFEKIMKGSSNEIRNGVRSLRHQLSSISETSHISSVQRLLSKLEKW